MQRMNIPENCIQTYSTDILKHLLTIVESSCEKIMRKLHRASGKLYARNQVLLRRITQMEAFITQIPIFFEKIRIEFGLTKVFHYAELRRPKEHDEQVFFVA